MVTVFAGAGGGSPHELAHAIGAALTGSTVAMALALAVAIGVMWRPSLRELTEPAAAR
jgi:ABC-type nitrate/sulfonate/bicarbonate transport system permease component